MRTVLSTIYTDYELIEVARDKQMLSLVREQARVRSRCAIEVVR